MIPPSPDRVKTHHVPLVPLWLPRFLTSCLLALALLGGLTRPLTAQQRKLTGQVIFDSNPANPALPLTLDFAATDRPLLVTKTVTLDINGNFVVTGLPSGVFTVGIKGDRWLRSNVPVNLTSGDVTLSSAVTLLSGDTDNNNNNDTNDLFTLLSAFNSTKGDGSGLYEAAPTADFNLDSKIDVTDLFLLLGNFNIVGDTWVANLRATSQASGVKLTWVASSGATSFTVLQSATPTGTYTVIASGVTGTTYTDTSATRGGYYEVQDANSPVSNIAGVSQLVTSLAQLDTAQPAWAEDLIPTDSPSGGGGGGPSSATSIDVSTGIEESRPGADLNAYNPTGQPAVFSRLYRSAQAARGYGSPGLPMGWTHNYDFTVTPAAGTAGTWGSLVLTYPNGAKETITTNAAGTTAPTVFTPSTPGTPYKFMAAPSSPIGRYSSFAINYKDQSQLIFVAQSSEPDTYRLKYLKDIYGRYLQLNYDTTGKLTQVQDYNTGLQLMSFTYSGGLLDTVTDVQASRSVTFGYGTTATVSTLTQVDQINTRGTAKWNYVYAAVNGFPLLTQTKIVDPTGASTGTTAHPASEYDDLGRITKFTDANGNYRTYQYGGGSTVVSAYQAGATTPDLTWTQNFDSTGANTGMQDGSGFTSQILYGDPANPKRPTQSTNRNGQVTKIELDGYGNIVRVRTPFHGQELATEYQYTALDSAYPAGHLQQMREGNLSIGANGQFRQWTTFTYWDGVAQGSNGVVQPQGLLKEVFSPIPGTTNGGTTLATRYTYTALGNIAKVETPSPNIVGSTTSTVATTYDYTTNFTSGGAALPELIGLPRKTVNPRGHTYTFDYYADGTTKSVKDTLGYQTDYQYNSAKQPTVIQMPGETLSPNPARVTMTYAYLNPGGPATQVNLYRSDNTLFQSVNLTKGKEDEFKTLAGDALPSGRNYDSLYRVKGLQDGRGITAQSNQFDAKGDIQSSSFATGSGAENLSRDAEGNVKSKTDALSRTTTYVLNDSDSLPDSILYPTSLPANQGRENVTLTYDAYARIKTVADNIIVETYSYDDLDNVTSVQTQYLQMATQPTLTVSYTYNADGSRASMTTPAGTYTYSYSTAGQLTSTAFPWNGEITKNSYGTNGRLGAQTNSLVTTTYITNGRGALTQVTNANPANANDTFLSFRSGVYDTGGNLRQINLDIPAIGFLPAIPMGSYLKYTYATADITTAPDHTGRLIGEASNLSGSGNEVFYTPGYPLTHSYDGANNPTTLRSQTLSYNDASQVTSQTSDAVGNALSYGIFDILRQLKVAASPVGATAPAFTAEYYPDGRRAWKESGGKRYYYLYDGETVIAELDANGNWTNAFGYGAAGLSERKPAGAPRFYAYSFDLQGNTVHRHDSMGSYSVDYTAVYDGYGALRSQVDLGNNQLATPDMVGYRGQFGAWTDNETDPVTSITRRVRYPAVWDGEREYDPGFARFITREYNAAEIAREPLPNTYIADPNPIGHAIGSIIAGSAGFYFGGPAGSAVATGAWEGLYTYALGYPVEQALLNGVVSGAESYAFGKVFELGGQVAGAAWKAAAGRVAARGAGGEASSLFQNSFIKQTVGGRTVYQIEDLEAGVPSYINRSRVNSKILEVLDEGGTNLDLMKAGRAPIGRDGLQMNLHHLTGDEPGAMLEILASTHQRLTRVLHSIVERGKSFRRIPGLERAYDEYRENYWKLRSKDF